MRIVMLGPPGAGKGTQARLLHEATQLTHISTGQLLRENLAQGGIGRELKQVVDRGELVPDDLMGRIVEQRLGQLDCADGFILDGFPRTLAQCEMLDSILARNNCALTGVVNLHIDMQVLIRRLTLRRVCRVCGRNYHLESRPPKVTGICDGCGERLIQRGDDRQETITRRLQIYKEETNPLVHYYASRGCLVSVSADQAIDKVTLGIRQALGALERRGHGEREVGGEAAQNGRMPRSNRAVSILSNARGSSASTV